jgi:hypothetical protein
VLRGDREHRWRCARPYVAVKDLARPGDRVADANPRRLRARPELEVLRAVVVTDAIDVVDGLPLHEVSPEDLFDNDNVLEHVSKAGARVVRNPHERIAPLVASPASPPVAVGWPGNGAA